MATSETKYSAPPRDFDASDCKRIIEIYESKCDKKIDVAIIEDCLYGLNLSFGAYQIALHQQTAPTATQLKKKHTDVSNKANSLLSDLRKKTDVHFLTSLASSIAGTKTPIKINGAEYENIIVDIYKKFETLESSLLWLTNSLDGCLKEDFNYLHTKSNASGKSPAINKFISDIALVLTKYIGNGGYSHNPYTGECQGWKIDCIEHLLNRINVSRSADQIFNVLKKAP